MSSRLTSAGTVAKYMYYEQGHKPTDEDIKQSEILEGRLREGFVRVRQLMVTSLVNADVAPPLTLMPERLGSPLQVMIGVGSTFASR